MSALQPLPAPQIVNDIITTNLLDVEGNAFLYDLSADTQERANRKDHEPQIHAELKAAWESWDATMSPREGMTGYCGDPAGQALELARGEDSNCKDYSTGGGA